MDFVAHLTRARARYHFGRGLLRLQPIQKFLIKLSKLKRERKKTATIVNRKKPFFVMIIFGTNGALYATSSHSLDLIAFRHPSKFGDSVFFSLFSFRVNYCRNSSFTKCDTVDTPSTLFIKNKIKLNKIFRFIRKILLFVFGWFLFIFTANGNRWFRGCC